ncbi:hypothetical protein SAMN00017405_1332 [Desulfonispora thiosulfatigenes DSM 11270]|uniref:Uncharacterized protein n=1 Tax=Desulfonispora thiosulfatigenes DSM 11270 TaxID=656914 RepID=A0A1W1VB42_DESTI|nr:hypothetical protein [Desulfonispora thiosulfatigenes]SMB90572.1 hypothetical protein SAMN00017405_1332 [Desulfonispora thiosulfatigenes DSM 11270]
MEKIIRTININAENFNFFFSQGFFSVGFFCYKKIENYYSNDLKPVYMSI